MSSEFEKRVRRDLRLEKHKKGNVLNKVLAIFILIILWISLLYFCILGILSGFSSEKKPVANDSIESVIQFANIDWDEDIFQNERWLERDRQIYFGDTYIFRAIDSESSKKLGDHAVFFYDYFSSIINGDAALYSTFFADSYPRLSLPNKFTKQKLFDIYALKYDGLVTDKNEEELQTINFIVEYKILENNGTFRDDLPSSVARKQLYRLITDEMGNIKIHSIVEMKTAVLENVSGTNEGWNGARVIFFGSAIVLLTFIPCIIFFVWLKRKKKDRV